MTVILPTKRSQALDACPHCRAPLDVAGVLADMPKQVTHDHGSSCGVCMSCGHVVAVWPSDASRAHVTASNMPYEWFHEWLSDEARAELHEAQEREHERAGRWG